MLTHLAFQSDRFIWVTTIFLTPYRAYNKALFKAWRRIKTIRQKWWSHCHQYFQFLKTAIFRCRTTDHTTVTTLTTSHIITTTSVVTTRYYHSIPSLPPLPLLSNNQHNSRSMLPTFTTLSTTPHRRHHHHHLRNALQSESGKVKCYRFSEGIYCSRSSQKCCQVATNTPSRHW